MGKKTETGHSKENGGKLKQAVALEYNPSEDAPRVIASGRGILVEK